MGRGIWIFDDLTPLREWSTKIAGKANHLFSIQPATRWRYHSQVSAHHEKGVGDNPPYGAIFDYCVKEKPKKPIVIEIYDSANHRVIRIDGKVGKKKDDVTWEEDPPIASKRPVVPAESGINRFVWDLAHEGAEYIPKARLDWGNPANGPLVSPGSYTVKLTIDDKMLSGKFEVHLDPRVTEPRGSLNSVKGLEIIEILPREADPKKPLDSTPWLSRTPLNAAVIAEAKEQEKLALQLRDDITKLTRLVGQVRLIRRQLEIQEEVLAKEPSAKDLLKQGKDFREKLDEIEAGVHNPKAEVTYDILAMKGGAKLYSQLSFLLDFVTAGDGSPTQGMYDRTAELERELEAYEARFDALKQEELTPLNALARKLQAPIIWTPKKKK